MNVVIELRVIKKRLDALEAKDSNKSAKVVENKLPEAPKPRRRRARKVDA